ncbi:hypothetical protein QQZ08_010622 [Neonectria magnoliae]|uniref:Uncharacterized protein n=1 Tax=Neonectria magnoliae TaxID=2732573 RepID=A0ABR1HFE3_9HYPO
MNPVSSYLRYYIQEAMSDITEARDPEAFWPSIHIPQNHDAKDLLDLNAFQNLKGGVFKRMELLL